MIAIRLLTELKLDDLKRVGSGYVSDGKFAVIHTDSETHASISLQFVLFAEPVVRQYDHYNEDALQLYAPALNSGYSFGAYDGDLLVGLLIAEPHDTNKQGR